MPQAIATGWRVTRKHFGFLAGMLGLVLVTAYAPYAAALLIHKSHPGLALTLRAVALLMGEILSIGIIRISLRCLDGESLRFQDLWCGWSVFRRFLGGTVLYLVLVGMGLVLLIVPGIIWAIRYQFFGYFVVDQDARPVESFRRSREITRGVTWNLLIFALLLGLLNLAGVLLLGVGFFVTIPLSWIAIAYMYRRLSDEEPATVG